MNCVSLRLLPLAALAMGLCSCMSTTPTAGDMDRYYKEAALRVDRQIAKYGELRDEGRITQEEYDEKVGKARNSLGKKAMELAWTHHEMAESVKRDLSIPTGDHPVTVQAPNGGDSFYKPAGSEGGPGYQGMGSGMWHGYQPGSMVDSLGGGLMRGF